MKNYTISVIIPVYNEEKYIEKCLESIAKQSMRVDQTLVINDGSTDNSKRKINDAKLQFKFNNLVEFEQRHQGPAVARNLGAKKAKGNILIFLDADMRYDKNFLEEITRPIVEGKEIATFTKEERIANSNNIWARFWDDSTFANSGKRVAKGLGERGITFRAIKATEFYKVGGYDSYGSSDDRSILEKLGKTSKHVSTAICYHYNPSSLSEVFYSARWIGRDSNNKYRWWRFFVFSPPWSIMKAVIGMVRSKNGYFFPFRITFDFGYFFGLVDIHVRNVHHK